MAAALVVDLLSSDNDVADIIAEVAEYDQAWIPREIEVDGLPV